jgi:glycolate oxidase
VHKVKGFTIEGEEVEFGSDALDGRLTRLSIVIGSERTLAVTTEVNRQVGAQAAAGALHHGQF